MKKTLFLSGFLILLTSAGCLVFESGRHGQSRGHQRYEDRHEVVIEHSPILVVRPPEIIVR